MFATERKRLYSCSTCSETSSLSCDHSVLFHMKILICLEDIDLIIWKLHRETLNQGELVLDDTSLRCGPLLRLCKFVRGGSFLQGDVENRHYALYVKSERFVCSCCLRVWTLHRGWDEEVDVEVEVEMEVGVEMELELDLYL